MKNQVAVVVVVCLSLVVVALLSSILYIATAGKPFQYVSISSTDQCLTDQCVALSKRMASNMNFDVSPCDDFEEFACGGYRQRTKFSPNSFQNTKKGVISDDAVDVFSGQVFEILTSNVSIPNSDTRMSKFYTLTRAFFDSCVSYQFILNKKSGDAIVTPVPEAKPIVSSFYRSIKQGVDKVDDMESFLALQMSKNLKTYVFEMKPQLYDDPVVINMNMDRLLNGLLNLNLTKRAFENFVNKLLYYVPEILTDVDIQEWDKIILLFDQMQLLKKNTTTFYFQMFEGNIDDLKMQIPASVFDWDRFFEFYFGRNMQHQLHNLVFKIYNFDLLKLFLSYYKSLGILHEANGKLKFEMGMLVVLQMGNYLLQFPNDLKYATEVLMMSRDKRLSNLNVQGCYESTTTLLGPFLADMYVKVYANFDRKFFGDLVQLINDAAIEILGKTEGYTSYSKRKMKKMMREVKVNAAYDEINSEYFRDYFELVLHLTDKDLEATISNFGNLFVVSSNIAHMKWKHLIMGIDEITFFLSESPFDVNAYYSQTYHKIIFPLAILSPYFFDVNKPIYWNLGAIGSIIGHELGHAVYMSALKKTRSVQNAAIIDETSRQVFLSKRKCLRDFMMRQELLPGSFVSKRFADMSNNDDYSDVIGAEFAYQALQNAKKTPNYVSQRLPGQMSQFTDEQIFFIGLSQNECWKTSSYLVKFLDTNFGGVNSHQPGFIRAKSMIINNANFADVFSCKVGDRMNAKDKCLMLK